MNDAYLHSGGNPYDWTTSTTTSSSWWDEEGEDAFMSQDGDILRFLQEKAVKKEKEPLDYTVVSVGVMTLGLILFVEVVRHHIDHSAHGRPFFKAVLDNVYSELATLGIVELFVFLLLKYYEEIDKERKDVFADVHFALFYTAILNAFQSALVAYVTNKASEKQWVKTESLELDHYVEIREEFDRVQAKLYMEDTTKENDNIDDVKDEEGQEFQTKMKKKQSTASPAVRTFRSIIQSIRHPGLRGRYVDLLVQVRFHELRLHFLEGNDLPLSFKVSEYLKRSEQKVLIKLVHISEVAWLLLTGALNVIYYVMGMIAFATADGELIGVSLTYVYYSTLVLYILICLALYAKMRRIFRTIISLKTVSEYGSDEHECGVKRQRQLFWFGNPQVVIGLIQFMQFGYALALAIVLMYWSTFTGLAPYWFLLAVLSCYGIFVYVLSMVVPQFTLCTSLGHLVDQKTLQETLAMHRLEEEQRRRKYKQLVAEAAVDGDSVVYFDLGKHDHDDDDHNTGGHNVSTSKADGKIPSVAFVPNQAPSTSSDSDSDRGALLSARTPSTNSFGSSVGNSSGRTSRQFDKMSLRSMDPSERSRNNIKLLAEMVKSDTASLRDRLPEDSRENLAQREEREQRIQARRKNRKRAVSDGVAAMRGAFTQGVSQSVLKGTASKSKSVVDASTSSDASPARAVDDNEDALQRERAARKARRKDQRKKTVSASAVIQQWRDVVDDAKARSKTDDPLSDDADRIEARGERRKANSASAVVQSWQDFSVKDTGAAAAAAAPTPAPSEPQPTESMDELMPLEPVFRQQISDKQPATKRGVPSLRSVSEDYSASFRVEDPSSLTFQVSTGTRPAEMSTATIMTDGGPGVEFLDKSGKDDEGNDDDTVDTDKSMGELSDVESIKLDGHGLAMSLRPSADHHAHDSDDNWQKKLKESLSPKSIIASMKRYFLSSGFETVSHVFGTLVIFFLIGQRIEAMIVVTGIFDASNNTWELRLRPSFWWQVAMYSAFILVGLTIMLLFVPSKNKTMKEKALLVATGFDLLISGGCLALLLIAESQRCCPKEEFDTDYPDDYYRLLAEDDGYIDDASGDCCPEWGHRTYGGLGNIEPFTGLIVLRIIRFALANLLVGFAQPSSDQGDEEKSGGTDKENSSDSHGHGHDDHGHGHGHGHDDTGTAIELWERAVSEHPDIVNKYGQFSSELFQVMLGLELVKETPSLMAAHAHGADGLILPRGGERPSYNMDGTADDGQQRIRLGGTQYCDLPAEAQGIIIAGRLGKPVRSTSSRVVGVGNLPTLTEEPQGEHESNAGVPRLEAAPVEFEIDVAQMDKEDKVHTSFIAPQARLLRSMRRCDRRLLPILKKWVAVDVVITQFEVVYLDAEEFVTHADDTEESRKQREASLLALRATKGGKGLRLCDVAAGRKVVGHLDLADVTEVHVERDLPLAEFAFDDNLQGLGEDLPAEYWLNQHTAKKPEQQLSRHLRWARIKEDRLKLVSVHGALILRFFSDLEETEAHLEASLVNEDQGPLKKDIALQWAQTVVHACGREQLKQSLPHYGEGDEELRDFLEVVHYHEKESEEAARKRAHQRRFVSATERPGAGVRRAISEGGKEGGRSTSPAKNRKKLFSARSFGEDGDGNGGNRDAKPAARSMSFRRSTSLPEGDKLVKAISVPSLSKKDDDDFFNETVTDIVSA